MFLPLTVAPHGVHNVLPCLQKKPSWRRLWRKVFVNKIYTGLQLFLIVKGCVYAVWKFVLFVFHYLHPNVSGFASLCVCFSLSGSLRSSTTPCWPRLVFTTTVVTTLSLAPPAESTTGCAHWRSSTPVCTAEWLTPGFGSDFYQEADGSHCHLAMKCTVALK